MSTFLFIVGLVLLIPPLLSLAGVTNVGLEYLSLTKIHTIPFLANYPSAWVYIVLGLIIIVIAFGLSRNQ